MYRENEALAVQKRVNWTTCCLEWWVGLAKGIVCWMGVHTSATWLIQSNSCSWQLWVGLLPTGEGGSVACCQITLGNFVTYFYGMLLWFTVLVNWQKFWIRTETTVKVWLWCILIWYCLMQAVGLCELTWSAPRPHSIHKMQPKLALLFVFVLFHLWYLLVYCFFLLLIIIIIQHLYSAIVSYAGCRGACGAS